MIKTMTFVPYYRSLRSLLELLKDKSMRPLARNGILESNSKFSGVLHTYGPQESNARVHRLNAAFITAHCFGLCKKQGSTCNATPRQYELKAAPGRSFLTDPQYNVTKSQFGRIPEDQMMP